MPLGNDPTSAAELEREFGITSSAEELIDANRARQSPEMRASGLKRVNEDLTADVQGDLDKLEKFLGVEVSGEPTVRGSGSGAMIHYTYLGPRDANEKSAVPYAEVYGDAGLKRRRQTLVDSRTTPDEAAEAAAAAERERAAAEAQEKIGDAQQKAQKALDDATEKARQLVADAQVEADQIKADAAEQVQKAADEAREAAEKDQAAAQTQREKASAGAAAPAAAKKAK